MHFFWGLGVTCIFGANIRNIRKWIVIWRNLTQVLNLQCIVVLALWRSNNNFLITLNKFRHWFADWYFARNKNRKEKIYSCNYVFFQKNPKICLKPSAVAAFSRHFEPGSRLICKKGFSFQHSQNLLFQLQQLNFNLNSIHRCKCVEV